MYFLKLCLQNASLIEMSHIIYATDPLKIKHCSVATWQGFFCFMNDGENHKCGNVRIIA